MQYIFDTFPSIYGMPLKFWNFGCKMSRKNRSGLVIADQVGQTNHSRFRLRFFGHSFFTSVSILKWVKNPNQTSLTNMTLEGIFHSNQHDFLTKFERKQNIIFMNAIFSSPGVPLLSQKWQKGGICHFVCLG